MISSGRSVVCSKSPKGSSKGSWSTIFLSAATGRICWFTERGALNEGPDLVPLAESPGDLRHRKGVTWGSFVATGERWTSGGCCSRSAAEMRLELSSKAVVSRKKNCRPRRSGHSQLTRLALAAGVRGVVRTVVWCFLRNRDVMGVAFLDTGCRNLDKSRFLAQLVNSGCPTVAHSGS